MNSSPATFMQLVKRFRTVFRMSLYVLLLLGLLPLAQIFSFVPQGWDQLLGAKVAFAQSPTLELNKSTTAGTVESGVPFEYIFTYKCASITTDCLGVTITDVLPADLDYVAGTATTTSHIQSVSHTAGTLVWTFKDPMPAGSTGVLRFSAQFKPGTLPGTTAQNEATMDGSNTTPVTAQSTVVTSSGAFEMVADKSGGPAVIGFPTDFSLGICSPDSSGGIRLTNAVMTDTLPVAAFFVDAEGVEGVDWTYTPTVAPDLGGTVVFTNLPTVEVGGCLTRRVTLRYDSDPGLLQTNQLTVTGDPEDGSPSVLLTDSHDFGVIAPIPKVNWVNHRPALASFLALPLNPIQKRYPAKQLPTRLVLPIPAT